MNLFSRPPLEVEIKFDDEESRSIIDTKPKNDSSSHKLAPLFSPHESVVGSCTLRPREGKRVEHSGVKVQFVGTVEQISKENKVLHNDDFMSWAHELAAPGETRFPETFPFEFKNVEKQYESYNGHRVRLRYFVRVTVFSKMSEIVRERDLWVYQYGKPQDSHHLVNMDIGIEGCLHLEFEYAGSHFNLTDTLVGRIYFLIVRLKLKHMELSLIRKEIVGQAPNIQTESETLVRYEIMDGSPVKGEQIPIRMHFGGFDLVPTMRDVNKKFSVRTYLSLVLVDESGRRYFKQSELNLHREAPESLEASE